MKKIVIPGALSILIASGFLPLQENPAQAEEAPMDRAQVEKIIREYLLANPELMIEVQSALETKRREQQEVAQKRALEQASDQIFNNPRDGVAGNPDGTVTVVEFFDYNCGFCKRALGDMKALIEENDDIRFVLKEFPILGPDSRDAHVVSMAFMKLMPEKYEEYHVKLLENPGRASEETAIKLALDLGADEAELRKAMADPEIETYFAETYALADQLSVTGTPAYVIGDSVVFGALGKAALEEKINAARTESN